MAETHAVMKSSLAKALIEAGVEHHDLGGFIGGVADVVTSPFKAIGKSLAQTNSYNASLAPTTQSNYAPTIEQSQQQALAVNPQQQALAQALLAQSQGQGPNPAQAALAQQTGQNMQQQAALMAGQRGAGANAGLIARQAAMQGANTEQQGIGQAATLQAQQQLAAQQQLGGLYAQQANQANQLFGTAANAQNAQNAGQIQNYGMQQGINSGVSAGNTAAENTAIGGLYNGLAGGAAAGMFGGGSSTAKKSTGMMAGGAGDAGGMGGGVGMLAYNGGQAGGPMSLEEGGGVPGKAAHPGNDIRNDVVPALLSKGEVVLPNSVTQSSDPVSKAAEFMRHLKGGKDAGPTGYDKVVSAKKSLKERVEHLEKMFCGGKA